MLLELNRKELLHWAIKYRKLPVGFPGFGSLNPLSFYLGYVNQTKRAVVNEENTIIKLNGDIFTFQNSLEVKKFLWYLNACTSWGCPIYGHQLIRKIWD